MDILAAAWPRDGLARREKPADLRTFVSCQSTVTAGSRAALHPRPPMPFIVSVSQRFSAPYQIGPSIASIVYIVYAHGQGVKHCDAVQVFSGGYVIKQVQ
jgi:hypothetical protein